MPRRYVTLFQYGSNMNPNRLTTRLDGVGEVIGVARLKGWGIRFDLYSGSNECAVTDIIPSAREHVQGVLYRLPYRMVVAPRGRRSPMDKIEGAGLGDGSNYKRLKVSVSTNGKTIEARTYVGTVGGRRRFLKRPREERRVSEDYFGNVLTGARQFRFPASYIAYLRRQAGL